MLYTIVLHVESTLNGTNKQSQHNSRFDKSMFFHIPTKSFTVNENKMKGNKGSLIEFSNYITTRQIKKTNSLKLLFYKSYVQFKNKSFAITHLHLYLIYINS